VLAALGLVVALVVVVEERGERGIGFEVHGAAGTAVAAVGTAARDKLLAAEGDATGAPSPPFTKMSISSTNISVPAAGGARARAQAGVVTMLT